jgi:spoIIIJ-associated protein
LSAVAAAEKVKGTGVPFKFNPMNSRERRVIHLALRNESEVRSESTGHGGFRQVVIYPAGMASLPESPPPAYQHSGRPQGRNAGRPRAQSRGRS